MAYLCLAHSSIEYCNELFISSVKSSVTCFKVWAHNLMKHKNERHKHIFDTMRSIHWDYLFPCRFPEVSSQPGITRYSGVDYRKTAKPTLWCCITVTTKSVEPYKAGELTSAIHPFTSIIKEPLISVMYKNIWKNMANIWYNQQYIQSET